MKTLVIRESHPNSPSISDIVNYIAEGLEYRRPYTDGVIHMVTAKYVTIISVVIPWVDTELFRLNALFNNVVSFKESSITVIAIATVSRVP